MVTSTHGISSGYSDSRSAMLVKAPVATTTTFSVHGSSCTAQVLSCTAQGLGCKAQGSGFRVNNRDLGLKA